MVTLGTTGIKSIKNAFGALPIQRVSDDYAVMLLKKAYDAAVVATGGSVIGMIPSGLFLMTSISFIVL